MIKKGFLTLMVLSLLMVLAVLLVGCSFAKSSTQNSQGTAKADSKDPVTIRVGFFPNITHAQALVGISDGSFRKTLGSDVQIEEHTFNAGPAEIEALLAGDIDLGYIGPVPAINGFVTSRGQLQIIAGASDAGAVLVTRKGFKFNDVKDLDGKKVAIPQLGNTQDISLRNLLAQAKLKDASKGGTVNIIPAENPDILTLIAKGEVDAALVPEPWGSKIVKEAGAKVALDAKQIWRDGKYSTAVVIVSKKFLDEHPDVVEKWLTTHVELTQRINQYQETNKTAINDEIKKLTQKSLSQDILDSAFKNLTVTYNPEPDSIKDFVELSLQNGYLKEKPDVDKLINLSILNKVLEAKGLPTQE